MNTARGKAVGYLALACVVMIVILNGKPSFTNASRPPRGIADSYIALQTARDVKDVDAVLSDAPSPDREVTRIKQYIDFAFIACYAGLYAALAMMFRSRMAIAAAACGILAAGFDVVENLDILRILDVPLGQTTQGMIDAIRWPSLAKWTLAFMATAIFASLFLKSRRRSFRIVGACNAIAALLGFYGLFDNSFLVWAGIPLVAGLIAMIAALLRFR